MKLAVMLSAGDLPTESVYFRNRCVSRKDLERYPTTPTLHNLQKQDEIPLRPRPSPNLYFGSE